MIFRSLLFLLLGAAIACGAPVSMRELEFLLRQQTPAAEIIHAVRERRLLTPIDAAAEASLRKNGADDSLIAALTRPEFALSPEESREERFRRMQLEQEIAQMAAQDEEMLARKRQQEQQIAAYLSRSGAVRGMLDGKLVYLDGDQVKPYDQTQLQGVRIYLFYYSAKWCGPCRQFTPRLVETYKALKAQYPTEFELIFVSHDRDEFNMHEYMRGYRMPWPAVRFGAADDRIREFAGESIPWLVAVSDTAHPLTRNGVDKKYIAPDAVLQGAIELLSQLRR